VAVGSVSHYLDRFVVSRFVRYTYGTQGSVEYNPSDEEHLKRSDKKYLSMTGDIQLDIFSPILSKVAVFAFRIVRLQLSQSSGYAGIGYPGISQGGCLH